MAVTSGAFVSFSDSGNINIDQIKQTVSHFNTACHITCLMEFFIDPGKKNQQHMHILPSFIKVISATSFSACVLGDKHTRRNWFPVTTSTQQETGALIPKMKEANCIQ